MSLNLTTFHKSSGARLEPLSHLVYVWEMALRPQPYIVGSVFIASLAFACGEPNATANGGVPDANGDRLPDALGAWADANKDGKADTIDINRDGVADGPAVDLNGDGVGDALALDMDCDGTFESYDKNGDGKFDAYAQGMEPSNPPANCKPNGVSMTGTGGSSAMGGSSGMGGSGNAAGSSSTTAGSGGGGSVLSQLGKGSYQGTGSSKDQYAESDVYRDGVGYKFIANGWGDKWQNHELSWNGTSYKVISLNGDVGQNYSPAGYPTVFCGLYSIPPKPSDTCGLPAAITSLKQINTGWRWQANGNSGQYNAAWDIWLGNGNSLSAYLMVWLRDPPGQQPAGAAATAGATVPGLPGTWNTWVGTVNGHPIVNYVKPEGQDLAELEFDVMDVYRDAIKRGYNLPGANIMSVAVGYEVWNGPITNLVTDDFYVDVK